MLISNGRIDKTYSKNIPRLIIQNKCKAVGRLKMRIKNRFNFYKDLGTKNETEKKTQIELLICIHVQYSTVQ